jgi:uncharacterized repeat protein (TIGR01451 family)
MKKNFFLFFSFFFFSFLAKTQTWSWIKRGPGARTAAICGNAIALDKFLNHIVITGVDSFNYGYKPPISFYVAKYDNIGDLLWQREFKGTKYAYDVETDSEGNIYFLSERFTSIDNQNVNIASPFCLVKLDPNGKYKWAAPVSGLNKGLIHEFLFHKPIIKIDKTNNLFFAASIYSENFRFLDSVYSYPAVSSGDVFVAKFDTAGKVKWSRRFIVGNGFDNYMGGVFDIDVNKQGKLAVVGFFDAVININGQSLAGVSGSSNPLGRTSFLVVLDASTGSNLITRRYVSDYTNNYLTGVILKNDGSIISRARVRGGVFMLSTGVTVWGGWDLVFTDNNGVDKSFKQIHTSHNYYTLDFGQDLSGNIYSSCYVSNVNTPTQSDSFNIRIEKYDTMGNFVYQSVINNLNIYTISYARFAIRDSIVAVTGSVLPRYGNIQIGNNIIDGGKDTVHTFVGSIMERNNVVTGTLFYDNNGNGIQDPQENGLPNKMIVAQPGFNITYTLAAGKYRLYTDTGSFVMSVPNVPRYHTCIPQSYQINFSDYGQRLDNRTFALGPIPNIKDLRIDIAPLNIARPGFPINYFITYANVGTTVLSGTYSFNFTNDLDFLSSDSMTTFLNSDSAAWSYNNLKPGEIRINIVRFRVKPTTPIGKFIYQFGYIYPILNDTIPSDNKDSLRLTSAGSRDPNDKLVDPSTLIIDSAKAGKHYLEYTIRFQNTGTDTAFNIRVLDTISSKLDINSFEVISSSHFFEINFKRPRVFEFYFPNILLPDSNRNEAGSHGFIKFRIKPVTSVILSDTIYNSASIYFDYNLPVETNISSSNFKNNVVTGVNGVRLNSGDLKLFPNPGRQSVTYKFRNIVREPVTVRIYDMSGRTVLTKVIYTTVPTTEGNIYIGRLKTGTYIFDVTGEKIQYQKQFVKL